MNLFLRLILTFLGHAVSRKPASGFLETTEKTLSVWITDQDVLGHLTNSRYASFVDLAIMDFMLKTRAMKPLRKRGWFPVISFSDTSFLKMLRFPQRFVIQTRLAGWTKTYVGFEHLFIRNGRVHARALTLARFVNRKNALVSIDEVRALLEIPEPSPDMPAELVDAMDRVTRDRAEPRGNLTPPG